MERVLICKSKRGGGSGLWGAYAVLEDEHGVWLYTPGESLFRGTTSTGKVVTCYAGMPDPPEAAVIHLAPVTGWWFARWQHAPTPLVAIDICTPCQFREGVLHYDDLELDLLKFRDGTWRLEDEAEFEDQVSHGRISAEEREASITAVRVLKTILDRSDDLFDHLAWDRLDYFTSKHLEPITSFD